MQILLAALFSCSLASGAAALSAAALPAAPTAARVVPACDDAYLGVYVLPAEEGGAEVTRLMADSPAEKAGIRPGDRIVELGGTEVDGSGALIAAIDARSAGEEVEVVLRRGGDEMRLTLTLGAWAESAAAREHPWPAGWLGRARDLRDAALETTPSVEVAPPAPTWVSVVPAPLAAHKDDLQARLDEVRARMEERWADLSQRMERYLESREGRRDRLGELRRELEASRREQERRMDELGETLRAALESVPPRAGAAIPPGAFRAPAPEPPGPPPATAEDVRALHDDVRALRREVQELKELLRAPR